MPIYEYRCLKCDSITERLVQLSERMNQKCDKCLEIMSQLVSKPNVRFVGTGFYENDYKEVQHGQDTQSTNDTEEVLG